KTTDIGGLQSGLNVAVTERVKRAWPFCTGKSPAADTLSLLTAFGCLPPPLMHWAVALRTMWTCVSLPSPASLPDTVSVLPLRDALAVTKCGLPANASWLPANMKRATRTAVASTNLTGLVMFTSLDSQSGVPPAAGRWSARVRRSALIPAASASPGATPKIREWTPTPRPHRSATQPHRRVSQPARAYSTHARGLNVASTTSALPQGHPPPRRT